MRIGISIEYLDPFRGGAEQWTYQFVGQLLERGHEVHVVAQKFSREALALPLTAHPLGIIRGRLARARAAERVLRQLELDVVHDMGMGWYCDIFQSHDGSRLVQSDRKLQTLPAFLRPLKRTMLKVLPRYAEFSRLMARQFNDPHRIVLALSRMVASDYQFHHGVPSARIRIVHNGVDTTRFSPAHRPLHRAAVRRQLRIAEDELLLLFVGHDHRRKGLATAVRAAERLCAAGDRLSLVVVGGRQPHWDWPEMPRRAGHPRVHYLGAVRDPIPYYAAADLFVLPSFYDPCSLSVLEAAASGLPSITTRVNGAGELLTEGVNGYLLDDPADDRTLAQRIRQLADPALRERFGQAAREMALDHTLERNCDRIVDLYAEVLARRRTCRPPLAAAVS